MAVTVAIVLVMVMAVTRYGRGLMAVTRYGRGRGVGWLSVWQRATVVRPSGRRCRRRRCHPSPARLLFPPTNEPSSPDNKRADKLFDAFTGGKEMMGFREFACCMLSVGRASQDTLVNFLFDLYDANQNKMMDLDELKKFFQVLVGRPNWQDDGRGWEVGRAGAGGEEAEEELLEAQDGEQDYTFVVHTSACSHSHRLRTICPHSIPVCVCVCVCVWPWAARHGVLFVCAVCWIWRPPSPPTTTTTTTNATNTNTKPNTNANDDDTDNAQDVFGPPEQAEWFSILNDCTRSLLNKFTSMGEVELSRKRFREMVMSNEPLMMCVTRKERTTRASERSQ